MKLQGLIAVAVLSVAAVVRAQAPATQSAKHLSMEEIIAQADAKLHYASGDVAVGSNLATLHLAKSYRYLDAADAKSVIVDAWGNPPGTADDVLGMIVSSTESPMEPDAWGIVVTHIDEGHIDDADAKKIDYDDMLKQLKEHVEANNEKRKAAGADAMHLIGWAQTPSYDETNKKLIWAKEFSSEEAPGRSLNYDVRVLGRTGVLSLNAVAPAAQLKTLDHVMADVATRTEFVSGQRYTDYHAGTDKLATYGVAGLIAGGIAAKAGLFKVILIGLIALKKFIIIGIVAIGAGIKKIFGGGKTAASTPSKATPATPFEVPPPGSPEA